jgi:transcriptional regulator with XRE-family HTH domain
MTAESMWRDPATERWEKQQARKLDAVPAELGAVVRAARKAEGLGVRELARRAGVSESQISRVENGKTTTPNDATLEGIANALGRPPLALLALTDFSEGKVLRDSAAETLDTLPNWARARHSVEALEDATLEELRPFARDVFLLQNLTSVLEKSGIWGGEGNPELVELSTLLNSLTPERRERCLQFVRDQARLSELDRRTLKGDDA